MKTKPWNCPKAVAVESYGFIASAPIWKKKGQVFILLTSEQMRYIVSALPQSMRWQLDGSDHREVSGYPAHQWLGYSDEPLRACPLGSSRGDLITDANALLDKLGSIETAWACRYVNGGRIAVALLQAACGKEPTGYAVQHLACESCDGKGSTGDYARGTGKQCPVCDSSGAVRETPPTAGTAKLERPRGFDGEAC